MRYLVLVFILGCGSFEHTIKGNVGPATATPAQPQVIINTDGSVTTIHNTFTCHQGKSMMCCCYSTIDRKDEYKCTCRTQED